MLISNGQVVDCLDVWRLSEVLDRSNEALGAWVEQIPGLPPICQPAKVDRLLVLGRSEAGALAETDQPWVMELVSSTKIDKPPLDSMGLHVGKAFWTMSEKT